MYIIMNVIQSPKNGNKNIMYIIIYGYSAMDYEMQCTFTAGWNWDQEGKIFLRESGSHSAKDNYLREIPLMFQGGIMKAKI